ncbi:hypothetical protein A464_2729 [Salmonella bongori N268-08]|uniref:Uncharacterized protein n=1 Tax=Salmonella bongori N268-08 TaxID=1197719 RepID=S5MZ75_SALBN|nr:hypothetical protein A464_2729 [Salmonella bongori N268-08]
MIVENKINNFLNNITDAVIRRFFDYGNVPLVREAENCTANYRYATVFACPVTGKCLVTERFYPVPEWSGVVMNRIDVLSVWQSDRGEIM